MSDETETTADVAVAAVVAATEIKSDVENVAEQVSSDASDVRNSVDGLKKSIREEFDAGLSTLSDMITSRFSDIETRLEEYGLRLSSLEVPASETVTVVDEVSEASENGPKLEDTKTEEPKPQPQVKRRYRRI